MALRSLWSLSRASVCRNGVPASGIHIGALEMQPTKVPLTEEEKKLLEKLGEPDSETRGYLSELYADFDVAAEKKREQRQEKKKIKEENQDSDPAKTHPSTQLNGHGIFSRMFHTSTRFFCDNKNLSPSLKETRKPFQDESRIIWDSQESSDYYSQNQLVSEAEILKHGESGVFDVENLVELLRKEKLKDVVVITVPDELAYADYLVLGTTISVRQGRALAAYLKKTYKQIKSVEDKTLKIEGEKSDEWKVFDCGNIILHLFDKKAREKYDIESLWTVGHEFDEISEAMAKENETQDALSQHMEFVRNLSVSPSATKS